MSMRYVQECLDKSSEDGSYSCLSNFRSLTVTAIQGMVNVKCPRTPPGQEQLPAQYDARPHLRPDLSVGAFKRHGLQVAVIYSPNGTYKFRRSLELAADIYLLSQNPARTIWCFTVSIPSFHMPR